MGQQVLYSIGMKVDYENPIMVQEIIQRGIDKGKVDRDTLAPIYKPALRELREQFDKPIREMERTHKNLNPIVDLYLYQLHEAELRRTPFWKRAERRRLNQYKDVWFEETRVRLTQQAKRIKDLTY